MVKPSVKVNRQKFVKSFRNAKKQRGLSTKTIAKNANLTPSWTYHVTSPKNKRPLVSKTVMEIGKGLGMSKDEAANWLDGIINTKKDRLSSKSYNLPEMLSTTMKHKNISPKSLAKSSGLKPNFINKLLNAKRIVKASKMDLARLANSLKINVKDLEKAKNISLKNIHDRKAKEKKDDKLAENKEASLVKFLEKRDKKNKKRRTRNTNNVTQHVHAGDVSIGNSKNPFSLNDLGSSQHKNIFAKPLKERLNVKALMFTAEQLSDMDISILNMIAQRLLQAEIKNS